MTIFESLLTIFEATVIFEATGALGIIVSSLKPNNQVKLFQIRDTLCMFVFESVLCLTGCPYPLLKPCIFSPGDLSLALISLEIVLHARLFCLCSLG